MNFTMSYILIGAIITFFAWRWIKIQILKKKLPELLQAGALIVDVRSPEEYALGHADGSMNLPLQSLNRQSIRLDKTLPIILCCASGTRSGIACGLLKKYGFVNVHNGGSWRNLS